MANKTFQYYKELPSWAKGAVIVGGGAILWFSIVRPIVNLVKKKLDEEKKSKETKESGKELSDLSRKGIKPTITAAQAEGMSNALRVAFSGCGTDEGAIYNVFRQLKNDADVLFLIKTYGIRSYVDCPWWSAGFGSGTTNQTLSAAISDELDSSEKAILNKILSSKGIKYQFS